MKTNHRIRHPLFCLLGLWLGLASVSAAEIRKASNGDPLDQGSSWIGGIAPTNTDVAVWESNSVSATSPTLDLHWRGIRSLENPALGTLTIPGGAYTLTLGDAGLDMAAADANLDFNCSFLSLDAAQEWNIGRSRLVTVYSENGPGTGALHKTGAGTLKLYYSSAASHLHNSLTLGLKGGTVELDGLTHAEVIGATLVQDDATRVQRLGGSSTLVLNNLTRTVGGTVDFAAGIASTSTPNDASENNGILGGWATVDGEYWAQAGGGNQPIDAYSTGYSVNFFEDRNINLPFTPGGYAITNTSGLAINSLRFDGDQTLTVGTSGTYSLTNLTGGILMGSGAIQVAIVSSTTRTLRGPPGGDLIYHVPYLFQTLSNQVVIEDNAICGLTKSGEGTLVLDQGTNNSFTGLTTINGGTLLTGGVNNRRYVSTNLLINPNGTYLHGSGDFNLTGTAITVNGGTLNLNARGDVCNSLLLLNNGVITGYAPSKSLSAGSALVPVDALWGTVDVRLTAPGGLTKTTDRKVLFSQNGTILKPARIEHGTLQVGSNATLTAQSFILGNGTNSGRLVLGETNGMGGGYPGFAMITSADLVTTNGTGTANAIVSGCGSAGSFSALILNFSGATNFDAGALGSPWPDDNYLGLTKSGLGELTLTGTGNYYGFTSNNVGSGTLKIGNANAIPSGTFPTQKGYVAVTSGTFDLNGFDLGIAGLFGNGTVTSSSGNAVTLTFREAGNGTFNGSLNNGVAGISVVQNGSGLQSFGGNNTYAGTTTINSGAIGLDGSGVIGNGTGTIFLAGGNLNLSGSRDPFTSPISNPITLTTSGAITSPGGGHQFSGLLSGNAGTLTLRFEGPPSGGFYVWFSAPFAFNRHIVIDNGTGANTTFVSGNTNGTTQTYNGNISGSGAFHRGVDGQPQIGGGTTVINGTNSYLGQTRVYDGTLVVNGAISNSWVIVHTNATLTGNGILSGFVQIVEGATLSPGTSVGRLNIASLSLSPGSTTIMELNGNTNDIVTGLNDITYSGTLMLSNLGPALVAGKSFQFFSFSNYINSFGTSFTNIVPATPGLGLVWDTTTLTNNGIIRVAGAPRFDGTVLSGTNLVFSGSGGTSNGSYFVLTSTNVASPLTNWGFLSTNTFDGNGNFQFTNLLSPGTPQRFFLLQLP
jgi:fibronectin-binding autotransporter adhesin